MEEREGNRYFMIERVERRDEARYQKVLKSSCGSISFCGERVRQGMRDRELNRVRSI